MKHVLIAALCCSAMTGQAHAAGENAVLKNTAVSKFSSSDYALMKARVDQALAADKDGDTLEWSNAQTGAAGTVTPVNRLDWNGMPCRRLNITNLYGKTSGKTSGKGIYKFCEKPAGRWKLVGPDPG